MFLSDYIFDNLDTIKKVYPHNESIKLIGFIIQTIENSNIDDTTKRELLTTISNQITHDYSRIHSTLTEMSSDVIEKEVKINVVEIITPDGDKFYLDKENIVYTMENGELENHGNIFENDKYLNQIHTYTCDMKSFKTKKGDTYYTDEQGKFFKRLTNTMYIRVK